MKKIIIPLLFLFSSCTSNRVEQEVRKGNYVTYGWTSGDIVYYSVDPINSLTDSLVTKRKEEAERIIHIISPNYFGSIDYLVTFYSLFLILAAFSSIGLILSPSYSRTKKWHEGVHIMD